MVKDEIEKNKLKIKNLKSFGFSLLSLIFIPAFLVLLSSIAHAGIGVSPGSVENKNLKPGSEFKQTLSISQSDPSEDINVVLEPDMGIVNDWITFSPGENFTIPTGQQRFDFEITVNVPEDADLKAYDGYLRVKASSAAEAVAGGVSVVQGARIDINLITTDIDYTDLIVRALSIDDVKDGEDIGLKMKIENKGNVAATPTLAKLEIMDLNQNPIITLETEPDELIEHGETKEIVTTFESDLEEGEYFAKATVYFNDNLLREETLVFRMLAATESDDVSASDPFGFIGEVPKANLYATMAIILIIAIGTIVSLMMYIKSTRKEETKREKVQLAILFAVLFIILSIVISAIINYDQFAGTSKDTEVKGISVSRGYNIYAAPNTESSIILIASENQEFSVIDETPEWFNIQLDNGEQGWILKADVKVVNTEEVE